MRNRYEIKKGEFNGCQKVQYYIWDTKMKRTVLHIFHGGVRAAKAIRKVLMVLILALLLGGCSQTKLTLPDGSSLVRTRFLDWEKIGSVSYDDGSFTLDGYESDLTKALGIIDRLIAREAMKP